MLNDERWMMSPERRRLILPIIPHPPPSPKSANLPFSHPLTPSPLPRPQAPAPTPHPPLPTPHPPTPHSPSPTPHSPSPTPHSPSPTPHSPSPTPPLPNSPLGIQCECRFRSTWTGEMPMTGKQIMLPEQGLAAALRIAGRDGRRARPTTSAGSRARCSAWSSTRATRSTRLAKAAYTAFFSENGLNPTAFPSLRRFETEVVAMVGELLGGQRPHGRQHDHRRHGEHPDGCAGRARVGAQSTGRRLHAAGDGAAQQRRTRPSTKRATISASRRCACR
jgi:hypothetical protein